MGAGILPIAEFNGTIFFLFGLESYDKKWGDFGGSQIKQEITFKNAIREGYEEVNGFLGTKAEIERQVKNNFLAKLVKQDKTYTSYLFKIQYDKTLPHYFNNHHKFMKTNFPDKINKNGFFEKSSMRWFTYNNLINEKHNFRYFGRNQKQLHIRWCSFIKTIE